MLCACQPGNPSRFIVMPHPAAQTETALHAGGPFHAPQGGVYLGIAPQAAAWPGGGVRTARWITFDQFSSETRWA